MNPGPCPLISCIDIAAVDWPLVNVWTPGDTKPPCPFKGASLILCKVKDGVPDFVESDTLPATAVENIMFHPITAHVDAEPESVTQMKVLER